MHIAIVTAGGAGMYCGSCMHDNTWARSLIDYGELVTLIPTYTPIRVDEENASSQRVFLGGLNVYLRAQYKAWRALPGFMTKWVDTPWVINLATKFAVSADADKLGALTEAMLDADEGPQREQYEELANYLGRELKPDVICFSNALLAGVMPALRRVYSGSVLCTLQGDDIFLDGLRERYRMAALSRLKRLTGLFDGFVTHSQYYRDYMARYLDLPVEKFRLLPLSIDLEGHTGEPRIREGHPFTVGYFARICPEKGLHQLVEAFRLLWRRHPSVRLLAGGYLGPRDRQYFQQLQKDAADLGPAFQYIGSPDRAGKQVFFQQIDVLSVPTVYQEPKGLYVLESLANGVPVVLPSHGAFPELVDATAGGLLVNPGDPAALATTLEELYLDSAQRLQLGTRGREIVHAKYHPQALAAQTLQLFQSARDVKPT